MKGRTTQKSDKWIVVRFLEELNYILTESELYIVVKPSFFYDPFELIKTRWVNLKQLTTSIEKHIEKERYPSDFEVPLSMLNIHQALKKQVKMAEDKLVEHEEGYIAKRKSLVASIAKINEEDEALVGFIEEHKIENDALDGDIQAKKMIYDEMSKKVKTLDKKSNKLTSYLFPNAHQRERKNYHIAESVLDALNMELSSDMKKKELFLSQENKRMALQQLANKIRSELQSLDKSHREATRIFYDELLDSRTALADKDIELRDFMLKHYAKTSRALIANLFCAYLTFIEFKSAIDAMTSGKNKIPDHLKLLTASVTLANGKLLQLGDQLWSPECDNKTLSTLYHAYQMLDGKSQADMRTIKNPELLEASVNKLRR